MTAGSLPLVVQGGEQLYRSSLSALLVRSPLHHSIGHSLGAAPQLVKAEHLAVAHLQRYIRSCDFADGSSWCAQKKELVLTLYTKQAFPSR